MESALYPHHYDLVTPDGFIIEINLSSEVQATATVRIEHIFSGFIGYEIDPSLVSFNLKSTLAQIGLEAIAKKINYSKDVGVAYVDLDLRAYGALATKMLGFLQVGVYLGKLFAADEKR
ncbi:MAG: hypothetical protein HY324_01185, partial [Chlamydiia bacterium]|nr:hypothetical protein [Chlamydiia bacterium]